MPSTFDYGDPVVRGNQQSVTIASGVATVPYPTPVVLLVGEGAANDTLDTLTVSGVTASPRSRSANPKPPAKRTWSRSNPQIAKP